MKWKLNYTQFLQRLHLLQQIAIISMSFWTTWQKVIWNRNIKMYQSCKDIKFKNRTEVPFQFTKNRVSYSGSFPSVRYSICFIFRFAVELCQPWRMQRFQNTNAEVYFDFICLHNLSQVLKYHIIFPLTFRINRDRVSHLQNVQNNSFSVLSKHGIPR